MTGYADYVVTLSSLQFFLWIVLFSLIHVRRSRCILAGGCLVLRPLVVPNIALFLVAVAFHVNPFRHKGMRTDKAGPDHKN